MSEINDSTLTRIRILALAITLIAAVLLARLWLLQVVWGAEYRRLAEENRVRRLALAAPRGLIFDRNNEPLVKNRLAVTLTMQPDRKADKRLLGRLSDILGMSEADIIKQANSVKANPIEPRAIKRDLSPRTVAYIEEHRAELPGVDLKVEAIREFPQGQLAAHVLGYLGELSVEEQRQPEFADYDLGDLVGKSGVERQYDNVLSGSKGTEFVEVNAAGEPVRAIDKKDPDPGNNLILTIDKKIQAAAEQSLAETMKRAKKTKFPKAAAGAIVVMSPGGEVLGMASYPTYDPAVFIGGVSDSRWRALTDKNSEYPLNNRAIMSAYPPGSTFKVVTAVAGLKTGVMTTGTTVVCRGRWTGLGTRWAKWCWDKAGHGVQSLEGALRVSCDSYFYDIGQRLYRRGQEDLQRWSTELGFGRKTNIDLPSEIEGRVPTAAWKREWNRNWPENQAWFPGDTVNMAIGQGDILATPLQMASLYAAVALDGVFFQPRVVKAVIGTDGRKIYEVPAKEAGRLDLPANQLAVVKRGLRRVVVDGTAKEAFAGFPVAVSGKTGTSEVYGKDDFALFVAYAPSDKPEYVVAVVIEQGGHGGSTAAPAARAVLGEIYGAPTVLKPVTDKSR